MSRARPTADAPDGSKYLRNGGALVAKASHAHSSDEFGKPASGVMSGSNASSFMGRRSLGAPSAIMVDGMAEHESGITPPPPPFSMRALVIGLTAVFLFGIVVLALMMEFGPQLARTMGS
jgi:hypothetical protein